MRGIKAAGASRHRRAAFTAPMIAGRSIRNISKIRHCVCAWPSRFPKAFSVIVGGTHVSGKAPQAISKSRR